MGHPDWLANEFAPVRRRIPESGARSIPFWTEPSQRPHYREL